MSLLVTLSLGSSAALRTARKLNRISSTSSCSRTLPRRYKDMYPYLKGLSLERAPVPLEDLFEMGQKL